jgi:general secretion pathway protein E
MADIGNELDLYTLAEELPDTDDLLDSEDDAPIIRLINAMLTEAIKEKASDIHIETYERHLQIRFRVDGVLREILRPQRRLAALLISRIKVMASLDIAENAFLRTGAWRCALAGAPSTCASPPCPPATANAWCCVCWTKTASTSIC